MTAEPHTARPPVPAPGRPPVPMPGARTHEKLATSRRRRSGTPRGVRRRPHRASPQRTRSSRRSASTASRPAACSPTSTTRRFRSASSRATRAPGQPRAATAPRARRRSTRSTTRNASCYPLQAGRRARRGPVGADHAGTRRSTTSPAGSARRIVEDRRNEIDVPRRPARARTATRSGSSRRGASTGTTATPTSARPAAGPATTYWMGYDRPSPDHANARVHPAALSSHLETGPLLQPARPADHGGEAERREARRPRPAAVQHRLACRLLDLAVAGQRGRDPPRHGARHPVANGRYDREFLRRWVNWDEYLAAAAPGAPEPTFESFMRRLPTSTRVHVRVRRAGGARAGASIVEVARAGRGRAGRGSRRTPGASAAAGNLGGWQVARSLFFLNVLTGSVGTPGGTSPERLGQVRPALPATCRRPTTSGTSCSGRGSTR